MKKSDNALPNELLSFERERHSLSQEEVAECIGADRNMVARWERGIIRPSPYYREKLAALFNRSSRELGFVRKGESAFWQVPHSRNTCFTGRDELLAQVHASLVSQKDAASNSPLAFNGLGGVGKTQNALEYAFRYGHEYQLVAWVRANSPGVLTSDFAALATLLRLPEQHAQDQRQMVQAVKVWLTNVTRWLLIFDNVNDLSDLEDFLPSPVRGHVLLTTRIRATGTLARAIEIEAMNPDEGSALLLCRANLAAHEENLTQTRAISAALGGLPLALSQAGAYIEETRCGLSSYLHTFETQRAELLRWPGNTTREYPEPVATTWSLSFEKLAGVNLTAHALLCFCAFLASDAIPEELLLGESAAREALSVPLPSDPLHLNRAIKDLGKFSLIQRRKSTNVLTIHRLVQAVVLDTMDEGAQRVWSEKVVLAVERAFPDPEIVNWPQCERLLSQAHRAIEFISRWQMRFPAVTRLLHLVGRYLVSRTQFEQAEQFFNQALTIREETLEPSDPLIAECLTDLGLLFFFRAKYAQAEAYIQRALAILLTQDLQTPQLAEALDNMALMYSVQEQYARAEPLYQQALQLRERLLGADHPDVSETLNNLAALYIKQENFLLAQPLLERAVLIREKNPGKDFSFIGVLRLNLAKIYREQGSFSQAEALLLQTLAQWEQLLGPEDNDVAYVLMNLARLYAAQHDYARAEPLFLRSRTIFERIYGSDDPRVIEGLRELARVYRETGNYNRAEQCYRQVITTLERLHGVENPRVAEVSSELAQLYEARHTHMERAFLKTSG